MSDNAKILAEKVMGHGVGFEIRQHRKGTTGYRGMDLSETYYLVRPKGKNPDGTTLAWNHVGMNCNSPEEAWKAYWDGLKFDPENNDADLMMCWDKFSERFARCTLVKDEDSWFVTSDDEACSFENHTASSTDRRKAMVECMVKAVM